MVDASEALPDDWPHRAASRRVYAGGLSWHVQVFEPGHGVRGPAGRAAPHPAASTLLLLHGTGSSGHSWAGLAPLLARRHRVIVPDLPGHAWTSRPARSEDLALPGMAASLGALLREMALAPDIVLGHSAGAAIGARMCLDGQALPRALVSVNGAWLPPAGMSGWFYSPLAKLLALNPTVPYFFAWHASRPAVLRRLLASTGSRVDDAGTALYSRLVSSPSHVGAVLAMMAVWDLHPLLAELPRLTTPLHLLVGERDRTVPPHVAESVRRRVPTAQVHRLAGLGHLAHEESPTAVAGLLARLGLVAD